MQFHLAKNSNIFFSYFTSAILTKIVGSLYETISFQNNFVTSKYVVLAGICVACFRIKTLSPLSCVILSRTRNIDIDVISITQISQHAPWLAVTHEHGKCYEIEFLFGFISFLTVPFMANVNRTRF